MASAGSFQIDATDLRSLTRHVAGLGQLDDRALLTRAGEAMVDHTIERLTRTRRSPEGSSWTPPQDDGLPLEGQGNLRRSIRYLVDAPSVEVGSPLPYAPVHQFGSPRQHIVAREYLGLSVDNAGAVERIAARLIEGALGAA